MTLSEKLNRIADELRSLQAEAAADQKWATLCQIQRAMLHVENAAGDKGDEQAPVVGLLSVN